MTLISPPTPPRSTKGRPMKLTLSPALRAKLDLGEHATGAQVVERLSAMVAERPATPAVRQAAARHGVDLTQLTGTGAGGRITLKDVRAAAPATPAASTSADDLFEAQLRASLGLGEHPAPSAAPAASAPSVTPAASGSVDQLTDDELVALVFTGHVPAAELDPDDEAAYRAVFGKGSV